MSLPAASARAVARILRCAGCALLLLVGMIDAPEFALGQDQSAEFSATVKVDATAENAAAARELARIDGQRRALALVIEQLSGSPEGAKLPKLDDKAITDMVESFEVANERMSAVHYLADYTFHFRPAKVRRLVRVVDTTSGEASSKPSSEANAKPAATEVPAKPVVVLPVYRMGRGASCGTTPTHGARPGVNDPPMHPRPHAGPFRSATRPIWPRSTPTGRNQATPMP